MRLSLLMLVLSLLTTPVSAEIYKVIGPDGKMQFTDVDPKNPHNSGIKEKSTLETIKDPATIVVYVPGICRDCAEAKRYLREHDIEFVELDLTKDAVAAGRHVVYTNTRNQVVITCGNGRLAGWNTDGFGRVCHK